MKNIMFSWLITGDERIELPLKVLETSVIPFDQSPMTDILYTIMKKDAIGITSYF